MATIVIFDQTVIFDQLLIALPLKCSLICTVSPTASCRSYSECPS